MNSKPFAWKWDDRRESPCQANRDDRRESPCQTNRDDQREPPSQPDKTKEVLVKLEKIKQQLDELQKLITKGETK